MWLISYNGEKQMTFLLIIIVTLILILASFITKVRHFLLLLFSRVELKANSKKTLWLNHHFMALLSSATQTQLYRTKDFRGLKFATNLQQSCTIFEFFIWARSWRGARAVFPVVRVSRWNVLIIQLKAVELRFSFKLCCYFWWTNKVVPL